VLHDYTQSPADLIATVKKVRSRFTAADRVDSAALSDFNSKGNIGSSTVTPGATSIGPSGNGYGLRDERGKIDIDTWAAAQSGATERPYAQSVAAAAAESTLTAFHQLAQRTGGVPGRKSLV
jgi:hypothetical protein